MPGQVGQIYDGVYSQATSLYAVWHCIVPGSAYGGVLCVYILKRICAASTTI